MGTTYKIKYEDINNVLWAYKNNIDDLIGKIDKCSESVKTIKDNGSFKGSGADNIKHYYDDVHVTLLAAMKVLCQNMLDNMILYKYAYMSCIDSSTNFVIGKTDLAYYDVKVADYFKEADEQDYYIQNTIRSVSDLVSVSKPDISYLHTVSDDVCTKTEDLSIDIEELENNTITTLENSSEVLLGELKKSIAVAGTKFIDQNTYQKDSFYTDVNVYKLSYLSQFFAEQHAGFSDDYDELWNAEEELKKLADERKEEGIWKTVGGVGLIVGGVVCIVATWGAATPVAVSGIVAGAGTIGFGVADSVEGGYEIYYGSIGDIDSTSVNVIKSEVFGGNEEAYQLVESAFAFTASAMVPVGAASKAGELTFRSGAVAVGKVLISDAAGAGASSIVYDATGNRVASMFAGMGVSAITGIGLNAIDNKFSISKGRKIIDTKGLDIKETKTADAVNKEWAARGYDNPPYDPDYDVIVVKGDGEEFVRVYTVDESGSNRQGGWLMRKSDIEGLTAQQIADKYALPKTPTHICDVRIPKDFDLETGFANPVEGWGSGGGQQFDTIGKRLPMDSFFNDRLIGE